MIHRYAKYFLFGYLFATWVNFATGYWSWKVVLDMFNGALMGYYMMTGFRHEARLLRRDSRWSEHQ